MMARRKPRKGKGPSRPPKLRRASSARTHKGREFRPEASGSSFDFRYLDHPADVGFVAWGKTLEETFAAAAQAMCEFGWELSTVKPRERIAIRVRAATLEDLLYSWLSEILFLCDAEKWVFKRFKVHTVREQRTSRQSNELSAETQRGSSASTWEVRATGSGEKFDKARHKARTYIKAVTYHQLEVKQTAKGWEATVYLDV